MPVSTLFVSCGLVDHGFSLGKGDPRNYLEVCKWFRKRLPLTISKTILFFASDASATPTMLMDMRGWDKPLKEPKRRVRKV